MAPKKKANKKSQDDWENELGDTIDPIAEAAKKAKEEEDGEDSQEDEASGGLLAALKKNRAKRAKKGKVVEDFVEGEDPTQEDDDAAAPVEDLSTKAPKEANMDDEDVFGLPINKQKGGKKQHKTTEPEDEDDAEGGGHLKTKKEKEREKKEREKQRKKEQVIIYTMLIPIPTTY
jgi:translation initiation factor 5B